MKKTGIQFISLFAAVFALSAQVRIPLGAVPLTMQSFAAVLAGYCLGPKRGAASALLYTMVGLAGIPVFSGGGGPAYVLSPTFGYILGFSLCAFLTGVLASLVPNKPGFAYMVMAAGLFGIYIPGVLWLMFSLNWIAETPASVQNLLKIGFFIPFAGDILTIIPAALISVKLREKLIP